MGPDRLFSILADGEIPPDTRQNAAYPRVCGRVSMTTLKVNVSDGGLPAFDRGERSLLPPRAASECGKITGDRLRFRWKALASTI
jgi:hypothetical protein